MEISIFQTAHSIGLRPVPRMEMSQEERGIRFYRELDHLYNDVRQAMFDSAADYQKRYIYFKPHGESFRVGLSCPIGYRELISEPIPVNVGAEYFSEWFAHNVSRPARQVDFFSVDDNE